MYLKSDQYIGMYQICHYNTKGYLKQWSKPNYFLIMKKKIMSYIGEKQTYLPAVHSLANYFFKK